MLVSGQVMTERRVSIPFGVNHMHYWRINKKKQHCQSAKDFAKFLRGSIPRELQISSLLLPNPFWGVLQLLSPT